MQIINLMANFEFRTPDPYAQPLHVSPDGRILRFMLKPGQSIREHNAPRSPFYVVVLTGQVVFAGGDGHGRAAGTGVAGLLQIERPPEPQEEEKMEDRSSARADVGAERGEQYSLARILGIWALAADRPG